MKIKIMITNILLGAISIPLLFICMWSILPFLGVQPPILYKIFGYGIILALLITIFKANKWLYVKGFENDSRLLEYLVISILSLATPFIVVGIIVYNWY